MTMLDRRLALLGGLAGLSACAAQPTRFPGLAVNEIPPVLAPVRANKNRLFDITACLRPFRAYMWYALAADQGNMPNAVAHRNALWSRMTPAAQNQARELSVACKRNSYKGCA